MSTAAGTANAQTSVTLYGVIDTSIEYATNVARGAPTVNASTGAVTAQPGGSRVALQSGGYSGSRWGLRGTEDLGAGYKAVFALESGFGVDTGTSQQGGRLFGRQAFVGVEHATYGKILLVVNIRRCLMHWQTSRHWYMRFNTSR